MNVREAIRTVITGGDLDETQSNRVASAILAGEATPAQIGALLAALRMKGETLEEIVGFARAVREQMVAVQIESDGLVDTCGTGGDGMGTFNVSTVSAFVAAAAGCRVAKHGNRSVSSACGSTDCLEALGIRPDVPPECAAHCIEAAGLCFLHAPSYQPALRPIAPIRQEIGCRTLFNILGPLANPAGARRQLIGVFERRLTTLLAGALSRLGTAHCLVVHGADGADEISLHSATHVCEVRGDRLREYELAPEMLGLERCAADALLGGNAETNARIALEVLDGAGGPHRDMVLLNAGAVIYVAGETNSIAAGVVAAAEAIDSGRARDKLEALRRLSREEMACRC